MPNLNTADKLRVGTQTVAKVYAGTKQVWPSAWTPASLSGLLWWLDASALAGADGTTVTAWPDGSGKGHACSALGGSPKLAHYGGKRVVDMTSAKMLAAGLGSEMSGRTSWSMVWSAVPTNFSSYPIIVCAPVDAIWNWVIEHHVTGGLYVGQTNGHYAEFEPGPSVSTWPGQRAAPG
jgi:hypothetical protein